MKKLLLITLFVGLICSASAQQKAFGDYFFGMTKKEAKKAYKTNKETHSIEIGGFEFIASPYNCEYDVNGLNRVSLYAKEVPMQKYLNKDNAELLLKEIKEVFVGAGYSQIAEHVFWPKPNLMVQDSYALMMKNTEAQKYMIIRIPDVIKARQETYNIWIDLVPQSHAEKLAAMKNNQVKDKADELKSKL